MIKMWNSREIGCLLIKVDHICILICDHQLNILKFRKEIKSSIQLLLIKILIVIKECWCIHLKLNIIVFQGLKEGRHLKKASLMSTKMMINFVVNNSFRWKRVIWQLRRIVLNLWKELESPKTHKETCIKRRGLPSKSHLQRNHENISHHGDLKGLNQGYQYKKYKSNNYIPTCKISKDRNK